MVPEDYAKISQSLCTRAFFWLKAPTSAFTFSLLRHYGKQVLVTLLSYSHPSFMTVSQFHIFLLWGAFNQENALIGAFSVIVKTDCETDGALHRMSGSVGFCPNLCCFINCGWCKINEALSSGTACNNLPS